MALIVIDVCLSDIPAENRTQGKNGKWYTKLCVADRKEKDQYDNTHTVYMNQTKEQREAGNPKHYVGNGKLIGAAATPPAAQTAAPALDDSLPF